MPQPKIKTGQLTSPGLLDSGLYGWEDITSTLVSSKGVLATDPAWAIVQGGIYSWSFSATALNEIWVSFHIPHNHQTGTILHPYVHWTTPGTNTGVVRWGFEYTVAKAYGQQAFPASSTVFVEQAASGTAYMHMVAEGSTLGSQTVNVGGAKVGSSPTGLVGTTTYTATVTVDGVAKPISILGSAAATYTTLITELNTDLGTSAVAALVGGNIKITSNATGTNSTISIADGTLFVALTGYVAILAAVPGNVIGSANVEPDSLVLMRVFRDGAHANDTCTDAAFGLTVALHHQVSNFSTPNKNYPFS